MLARTHFRIYFGPMFQLYCFFETVPVSHCLGDALAGLPQDYGPFLMAWTTWLGQSLCTTSHRVHFSLANFVTCYLLIPDLTQVPSPAFTFLAGTHTCTHTPAGTLTCPHPSGWYPHLHSYPGWDLQYLQYTHRPDWYPLMHSYFWLVPSPALIFAAVLWSAVL